MKPLEWIFILMLYIFDKNPENKIKTPYLKPNERTLITQNLNS